jgi:hypothetical protein
MRPVLLLSLLFAVFLAGCSTTIDDKKGEKAIKANLVDAKVKSVDCPSGLTAKKDATFQCDVVGEDGSTAKVDVTEKDDKGHVDYDPHLASESAFEDAIATRIGNQTGVSGVKVDCPNLIQLRKGAKTTCDATAQGDKIQVVVTQNDASGNDLGINVKQ